MGCDGGTIPKRKEIVKNKEGRPKQTRKKGVDEAERWRNCAICDWTVKKPIVSGQWGHIFCKECVIQFLIDHKKHETLVSYDLLVEKSPVLDSLHSTKDIKALVLKENPDVDESQAANSEEAALKAKFVCPITGLETNGKYKFVFSWNCGCVVSEKAIKEVPNDEKCLVCQTPYMPFDLVTLNPDKKDLETNQCAFMVRKMRPHLEKVKGRSEGKANSNLDSGSSDWDGPSTSKGSTTNRAEFRKQREQRRKNAISNNHQAPSTSRASATNSNERVEGGRRQHEDESSVSSTTSSPTKRRKS